MAKLITTHDPYHVHAILGVLALCHYAYRTALFFKLSDIRHGGKVFVTMEDVKVNVGQEKETLRQLYFDLFCVTIHLLLMWSALLMPLPSKRNFKTPVMWPELRWHSIIFGTRHVIGTYITILGLWPKNLLVNYASKLALIYVTCYSADVVTQKMGSKEKRTTNSMVYPENVTVVMQKGIKESYSVAQFLAVLSVVSEDPDLAFFPLMGIQSATFGMTLVRKNLMSSHLGHRQYAFCLYFPAVLIAASAFSHKSYQRLYLVMSIALIHMIPFYIRVKLNMNKYIVWAICAWMQCYLVNVNPIKYIVHTAITTHPIITIAIGVIFTWIRCRAFIPLFFGTCEEVLDVRKTVVGYLTSFHYNLKIKTTNNNDSEPIKKKI